MLTPLDPRHCAFRMRFTAIILAAFAVPTAPAIAQNASPSQSIPAPIAEIARGNRAFAVSFYSQLRTVPGNLAFSPASISLALGMTFAGARGETATAMARVLHFSADATAIHSGFHTLLGQWSHPTTANAYQLDIANRLFAERTYALVPAFAAVVRDQYGAPVEPTDWRQGSAAARVHVNDWVLQQTHDRIRELIPPDGVSDRTRLVLVNAIYFHGAWQLAFPAAATTPAAFQLDAHTTTTAPMMRQTHEMAYAHVGNAQVVELPYRGGDLAFDLVVPDAVDGLGALEHTLDAATLERWTASLSTRVVALQMPRFRAATTAPATQILRSLGMTVAFDPQHADFTGIGPETPSGRLFIGGVFHKAFVEVNEEGTEAAAATAVSMSGGGRPAAPPSVIADHPFLFLLRDLRSGTILFMGRVSNPAAA